MRELIDVVKAARRVSTPLLAIQTPDQQATMFALVKGLNGNAPKFAWDVVRGIRPLTPTAKQFIDDEGLGDPKELASNSANPTSALELAGKLPEESVLFLINGHRFVGPPTFDAFVSTGVGNLRDLFKGNRRTCILLGPSFTLPAELRQDVMVLDEPLPNDAQLAERVLKMHALAKLPEPTKEALPTIVDSIRGLSVFAAESVVALSLRPEGLDLSDCWERKRAAVNQTKGLTISMDGPTFSDLGGLDSVIDFGKRLFAGPRRPRVVVRVDEIEKAFAAAQTDTTGVTQDQVSCFLKTMEDQGWDGMIAVGPPGSGKSLFSKALATTHRVPTIEVDLGAMKGSLVGQSEDAIREAIKVIQGVGAGSVFVVATCNKLDVLPPELRRRFLSGIWYFDLPSAEERASIWNVNLAKHGFVGGANLRDDLPADQAWTGAEIRNCCRQAQGLACSLREASGYIVPVAKADPRSIERLRDAAEGKWLSATQRDQHGKATTYMRHGEAAERMIDLSQEPTVQPALIVTGPPIKPEEPKPPKGGLN